MLKNASGCYCYRHTPWDQWLLSGTFTPDEGACNASIAAKDGPLPIGAHTWTVADGGKPVDGTLTVGLLVRTPLPSPAACAPLLSGPCHLCL